MLIIISILVLELMVFTSCSTPDAGCVLIVGSTNADIFVPVSRFPQDGENLVAPETTESGRIYAGGKGAIQAVACAKMGVTSRFVT